jgi:hypothetical protein
MSEEKRRQGIEALFKSVAAQRDANQGAELAAFEAIWRGSRKYGVGALLEAFRYCGNKGVPMPLWLVHAVNAELIRRVPKQLQVDYRRWREVRKMRDTRALTPDPADPAKMRRLNLPPAKEIGYDETFAWVAERLRKTAAKAKENSAKTIEGSYGRVERSLPKRLRYKPTYRKRTR